MAFACNMARIDYSLLDLQVLVFMHMENRAVAAGLWPPQSSLPAAICTGQLLQAAMAMSPNVDAFMLPTLGALSVCVRQPHAALGTAPV
jgi:hypothetical protein